jgi:hypothetical protein
MTLHYRRDFAAKTVLFFVSIAARPLLTSAQSHHKGLPDPPLPGDPQQRDKLATPADPKAAQQGILQRREQAFRSDADKLLQWASELREEIKNTPGNQVLSVKTYKRLQEIEKLTKKMQSEVRG